MTITNEKPVRANAYIASKSLAKPRNTFSCLLSSQVGDGARNGAKNGAYFDTFQGVVSTVMLV